MTPLPMTRIYLADDHPVVRRGIVAALAQTADLRVTSEVGTVRETLARIQDEGWDVLVLDLSFPDGSGLDVLRQVEEGRRRRVLALSMHRRPDLGMRVLQAGAGGYVTKDAEPAVLFEAIRRIAAGRRYVPDWLGEALASHASGDLSSAPHVRLSDRELQIFLLIAGGARPRDIARDLALSPKTVSTYRARILDKLGVRTTAGLAAYAIRYHLMD